MSGISGSRRLLIVALLAVAALLALLRPGMDGSPWLMLRLFHADVRADSFRHMDRVFPSIPLPASRTPHVFPSQPSPLPAQFAFDGQSRSVDAFLARTQTAGLLVLRDGVVVHEQYGPGASAESRFTSWSVAKSVVATLVGIALEEGSIRSLDDTVGDYVQDYRGSAWENVRLRDLLRMASGIAFDERYFAQFSDIQQVMQHTFLLRTPIDTVVRDYPAEAAEQPPGSRFHYISVDTQVLANVLRHATGRTLTAYAQEKLWHPLGMADDAYWNTDTQGTPLAFCCLNATLRGFAAFGQLWLQQGQWHGQQVMPGDWVRESTRPDEPWLQPGIARPDRGYGYHWWIPPGAEGEYFAHGIWGQYVWIDERHGVVIVKTSVDPDFEARVPETIAFFRGVARRQRPAAATPVSPR